MVNEDIIDQRSHKAQGYPDSKVHGANMGPILGRQDPGGPHVGPMNFVIWVWKSINCNAFNTSCVILSSFVDSFYTIYIYMF